ncbi:MAG: dTDP-4-dehydrorhamnose reductase [Candidatus Omnitrophica bacterium]|nr:dTDP-4-dehydrorhamnose reductase [Candidatus Omnitrophota bacterium]
MRWLITGVTGLVGSSCVEALSKRHTLHGLARRPAGGLKGLAGFETCDIADGRRVEEVARVFQPDVILHAAALADVDYCEREPDLAQRVNVEGTRHVAQAADTLGALLVFISTDYVFDGKGSRPYREDDPTGPVNVYGRTKVQAEGVVRRVAERHVIVRSTWLFGAGGSVFMRQVLKEAGEKRPLSYVADKISSPTHAGDLAEAIEELVLLGRTGTVHVTNAGAASWYDFACEILRAAHLENGAGIQRISRRDLRRDALRPAMTALDNSRFKEWTGRALRPWQEAVRASLSAVYR